MYVAVNAAELDGAIAQSSIRCTTSLIWLSGVEVPAVIPMESVDWNHSRSRSVACWT